MYIHTYICVYVSDLYTHIYIFCMFAYTYIHMYILAKHTKHTHTHTHKNQRPSSAIVTRSSTEMDPDTAARQHVHTRQPPEPPEPIALSQVPAAWLDHSHPKDPTNSPLPHAGDGDEEGTAEGGEGGGGEGQSSSSDTEYLNDFED